MTLAHARIRPIALIAGLVLALTGVLATAGPGAADSGDGHITGHVTEVGGAPLPDVTVFAYSSDDGGDSWHVAPVGDGFTDATGAYDIGGVTPGTYRVRFIPDSDVLGEWWDDARSVDTATDILVGPGETVSDKDAVLGAAGSITGEVTADGGSWLSGITVTAYTDDGSGSWATPAGSDTTIPGGTYEIADLPVGDYRVGFHDGSGAHLDEYWDDQPAISTAQTVSVRAQDLTYVAASLTPAAAVHGTVDDTEGPLADAYVTLSRRVAGAWDVVGGAWTDESGDYAVDHLRAGTYRVRFTEDDHRTEWYDDASSAARATLVRLSAGSSVDADARLTRLAHVTGTVTETGGAPVADARVELLRWDARSRSWAPDGETASSDAAGHYDVGGLVPGRYRVRVDGPRHLTRYYPDAGSVGTGTTVVVGEGATVPAIDVELARGATLSGTVTAAGGGPLPDVSVTAYRYNGDDWVPTASATTQTGGAYVLPPLPTGGYRIGFADDSGSGYMESFLGGAATLPTAATTEVVAGQDLSGRDVVLQQGGHVTGHVTGSGGAQLDDVLVVAYTWLRGEGWVDASRAWTTTTGAYDLAGLPTGRYRLLFMDGWDKHLSEFYDDAALISDATTVPVTAGQTVTGKDAVLASAGRITGTVTGPGATPVLDGEVYALEAGSDDWEIVGWAATDASGHYEVGGLRTGDYLLYFGASGYHDEWWDDAADYDDATPVHVTTGQTRAGIDAELATGGGASSVASIAGTVTGPDHLPLEDVAVTAYQWDDEDEEWYEEDTSWTDESGAYSIGGLSNGAYRLGFEDESERGLASEFWDDAPSLDDADSLTITGGAPLQGVDAELAEAGRVRGVVTSVAGTPLEHLRVTALALDQGEWTPRGGAWTDEDGSYDLDGLAPGTYRIRFRDNQGRWTTEYWDDQLAIATAADVHVTAGGVVDDVDAGLAQTGAHLTGRVTDADGEPLPHTEVHAWRKAGTGWVATAGATTDEHGGYDVSGLAAGSYLLAFDALDAGYALEYYDDSPTYTAADLVPVTAGATVAGLDATLGLGAGVSGTVSGHAGRPLEGVTVTVYESDAGDWEEAASAVTDEDGAYWVTGLEPGTYRVGFDPDGYGGDCDDEECEGGWFEAGPGVSGYLGEFWNDAADLGHAADVVLTKDQQAIGRDAQLSRAGRVSGTVTRPGGTPLDDVEVVAYRKEGSSWEPVAEDYTDPDGGYLVEGLEAGTYRLEFTDASGHDYPTVWWGGASDVSSASDVTVALDATTTGKNVQMTAPLQITGVARPTVLGTPRVGSVLSATLGTWSPNTGLSYDFRWRVGAAVTSTGSRSYVPTADDVGKTITVEVTVTRAGFRSASSVSPASAAVLPDTGLVIGSVGTIRQARVGAMACATGQSWTSYASVARQWLVGGKPVPYGDLECYEPRAADLGKTLTETVTVTYGSHPALSATTPPVTIQLGTNSQPRNFRAKVTGRVRPGATLVLDPGRWYGYPSRFRIQWYAGGKPIARATGKRLRLVGATARTAAGKAITVRLTVTAPGYQPFVTTLKAKGRLKKK